MAKVKAGVEFVCRGCGFVSPKWAGKCPECGAWSSFDERPVEASEPKRGLGAHEARAVPLRELASEEARRVGTGNAEFDRTLGGGFVPGSLVLVGGDPGIGKSTLVLQTLATMAAAGFKALYVSGEESAVQVKLRSERLQVGGSALLLMCETSLEKVLEEAKRLKPDVMVIDSIQTVYKRDLPGTPGAVSQLRECTLDLMVFAKTSGCITILIGHVTKEGQIAGPRILEHMVDTVAYFEGDRNQQFRVLRTIKNRFGATDELGVFEMTALGLVPVENPSKAFLQELDEPAPGSVVSCTIEGSRAILFEAQALVNQSSYAVPQRVAAGVGPKRLTIILALLEKFGGIMIGASDVFASIAGGMHVNDTATDLALALAVAGNYLSIPMPKGSAAIGELGLSGEVRAVSLLDLRIKEAARSGFRTLLVPAAGRISERVQGVELIRVGSLAEAIEWLRGR